jgi:hypothetical protein
VVNAPTANQPKDGKIDTSNCNCGRAGGRASSRNRFGVGFGGGKISCVGRVNGISVKGPSGLVLIRVRVANIRALSFGDYLGHLMGISTEKLVRVKQVSLVRHYDLRLIGCRCRVWCHKRQTSDGDGCSAVDIFRFRDDCGRDCGCGGDRWRGLGL